MKKVKYGLRSGVKSIAGVSAQAIGQELEHIRIANKGQLKPRDIVEAARPDDAPLHPVLTWDDEAAAESWRHHEARNLVRAVVVIGAEKETTPAFYHVAPAKAVPYYQSASILVENVDEFSAALSGLQAKLIGATHAVETLRGLAESRGDGDKTIALLSAAMEALSTAREIVARVV